MAQEEANLLDVFRELRAATQGERRESSIAHECSQQELRRYGRIVGEIKGSEGAMLGGERRDERLEIDVV